METKYDILLLNVGSKLKKVEKLILEYISDKYKVKSYIDLVNCEFKPQRVITNISLGDANKIEKKFIKQGADVIILECDILTLREDKINELLN